MLVAVHLYLIINEEMVVSGGLLLNQAYKANEFNNKPYIFVLQECNIKKKKKMVMLCPHECLVTILNHRACNS